MASFLCLALTLSALERYCDQDCHSDSHQETCQCTCHAPIPPLVDVVALPENFSPKILHFNIPEDQKSEIHRGTDIFRPPAVGSI